MSQPSTAPNDKESVRKYVRYLSKIPYFKKIMVRGSRSPKRKHNPRPHSDWDLVIVSEVDNVTICNPRKANVLHADVFIVFSGNQKTLDYLNKDSVEIWPKDEHGILS